MLNRNALRAEIVRNGMTQKQVASMIGMSESTFVRKMKNGSFGTDEAQMMIDILNIQDPCCVFFAKGVTYEVAKKEGN